MELGAKIKRLREENGLKQSVLAEMIEVRNTVVSNWETNLSKPSLAQISNLCYVFQVNPDYFFDVHQFAPASCSSTTDPTIEKYNLLNDDGKAKAAERIDELLELPRYRKNN